MVPYNFDVENVEWYSSSVINVLAWVCRMSRRM